MDMDACTGLYCLCEDCYEECGGLMMQTIAYVWAVCVIYILYRGKLGV